MHGDDFDEDADASRHRLPATNLTPLAGPRDRTAPLKAGALVVAAALIVSVGIFGRFIAPQTTTPGFAGPSPPSGATATTAPATADAADPAAPDRSLSRTILPLAGYEVAFAADATHRPLILDGGAVAIFDFGAQGRDGSYAGEIRVDVGTPYRGAAIVSDSGFGAVFATDLGQFETVYRAAAGWRILARESTTVDGVAATLLQVDGGPGGVAAALLAVHGNRVYAFTSAGFRDRHPEETPMAAARAGLMTFVAGFRFGTGLFVSRELGFQVPLPVAAPATGVALHAGPDAAQGSYVFPDGRSRGAIWSHAIAVSVGTRTNPAAVAVLTSTAPPPNPAAIWAAGLVELQARYVAAVSGRVGSGSLITVGGELALLIDNPAGIAEAVLLVHHRRVYIITTTGVARSDPGPNFGQFLDGFVFLD